MSTQTQSPVEVSGNGKSMPEVQAQAPPSSRLKWIAIVAVVIVAIITIPLFMYYSERESTDDAQIDGHIHPVASRVGGTVIRVLVENNQEVQAGQLLAEIDPRDYQTALARAQGDLAEQEALSRASQQEVPVTMGSAGGRLSTAQAGVEQANAGVLAAQRQADAARAQLNAAQARLREAAANSQKAAKDLDRMKQLIAKDEISQQQYDTAVAAAESARAAEEAVRATVADAEAGIQAAISVAAREQARVTQAQAEVRAAQTAPQQVGATQARAESARAKADQAKADLEQAQLNLEYTQIKAPVAGVVSKKAVEVGQTIQPGQPLLAVVSLGDVWVTANFKETQLKDVHAGQKATISVDAYGGRKYEGHVESIAAATGARFSLLPPENATGNYVKVVQRVPVKIRFEKGQDPEHLLRPGMSVQPTIRTK